MVWSDNEIDSYEKEELKSKNPDIDYLRIVWFSIDVISEETSINVRDLIVKQFIESNKKHFFDNLFIMIENWKFEWEYNRKVTNLIDKSNTELLVMWFDIKDIIDFRLKTENKSLNIEEIIQFELKTSHQSFVWSLMEWIEKWDGELTNYVCKLAPYQLINIWFKYPDLDLIGWCKRRAGK